jgi:hypothetical protein
VTHAATYPRPFSIHTYLLRCFIYSSYLLYSLLLPYSYASFILASTLFLCFLYPSFLLVSFLRGSTPMHASLVLAALPLGAEQVARR